MKESEYISVVCPTYNEARYIEKVLSFFINAEPKEKELIIIDGGSTDGTKDIVRKWSNEYNNISLLENPDKYVPFALNKGIKASKGDLIVRLDAHTEYAEDYILKITETFKETKADIVGGPMNARGKTTIQKAIAYATSTSLGIGDSKFHDITHKGYVDSVYLGAWKKELFEETGYFDERMIRNQDDEFHYRAKSKGKKIYLNPEIKSYYEPRGNLKALFKQYFQYGLYKPLVLKKIKSEVKIRHLIPALFTIYLILCIALFNYFPIVTAPLLLYIMMDIIFSIKNKGSTAEKFYTILVYPILHISYGTGFIRGIFKVMK